MPTKAHFFLTEKAKTLEPGAMEIAQALYLDRDKVDWFVSDERHEYRWVTRRELVTGNFGDYKIIRRDPVQDVVLIMIDHMADEDIPF